jgi:hypothetical protein
MKFSMIAAWLVRVSVNWCPIDRVNLALVEKLPRGLGVRGDCQMFATVRIDRDRCIGVAVADELVEALLTVVVLPT